MGTGVIRRTKKSGSSSAEEGAGGGRARVLGTEELLEVFEGMAQAALDAGAPESHHGMVHSTLFRSLGIGSIHLYSCNCTPICAHSEDQSSARLQFF